MRGGYIHNRVLLEPIAQKALQLGFDVNREAPITVGNKILYGDLIIQRRSQLVLVEVELSSKRIANDLAKAVASGACELWLVVPNPNVARSVRSALSQQSILPDTFRLAIFLLPQALQRLKEFSELISGSNVETEKKRKRKNIKRNNSVHRVVPIRAPANYDWTGARDGPIIITCDLPGRMVILPGETELIARYLPELLRAVANDNEME